LGIIGVVVKLRMLVKVSRPCVDVVKGVADVPICAIATVKSAYIEAVDNPREAGALTEGAVESKSPRAASPRRGVERDGLAVAEPRQELSDRCLLLNQA
jgi:hypothetical protein